jgi:putative ABC transport system permease protein
LATVGALADARHNGFAVPYVVSLPAFLSAALVSALIGIIFGLYPAKKASAVEPIAALRYE